MAYQVNERALARWAQKNLRVLGSDGPATAFRFRYTGSICVNGGDEFSAYLDLTLVRDQDRYRITAATITLDPEDTGTPTSCHYGSQQRETLLARNVVYSGVIGADLEEFLQADRALNPGGCFCSVEHLNHKLILALQTILYSLQGQESPHSEEGSS